CRRVLVEEGLVVRSAPSTDSAVVGGVSVNEEIFVTLPLTPVVGDEGRSWVEIVSPLRGYVSSGYANNGSNLGACL
ncbi:SH3 domain-containing protein, partial [Baaleninema sp.]|uniref:SH3 domain-containing protein n=1 Tax=Baaleninema sp. TaxID=3101197 RepID=UPI003D039790